MRTRTGFAFVCLVLALAGRPAVAAAQAVGRSAVIAEPTAQRYGLHRAWVVHVDLDSAIDRIERVLVDRDAVFVQTVRGVVQCLDSETGVSRWSVRLANPNQPSSGVGANDKYAAVANGVTLYLIDRVTGQIAWSKKIHHTPAHSPAVSFERVFMPCLDGTMVSVSIDEPRSEDHAQRGSGIIFGRPIVTPHSIVWGTETGRVMSFSLVRFQNEYQVKTGGPVTAVSYGNDAVYASSRDWYVYALRDGEGTELWRFAAGNPVSHVPVPVGDSVYILAEQGGMFRVAAADGSERWWSPGITQLLAANESRLYAGDEHDQLTVIDANSGSRLASVPAVGLTLRVTNVTTDRIYLGTESGILQCLHEIGRDKPLVHQKLPDRPVRRPSRIGTSSPAADEGAPADEPAAEAPAADDAPAGDAPAADDAPPADAPADEPPAEDDPFAPK
ncbi:MAG: PQQ-binding-like beta-propeller repeat protein [Pirellulales bacterium]|nr:PQQ-binding-like beta-propeller repeat protein [Pirellulales bacterium]